jgi:hypothetical protein
VPPNQRTKSRKKYFENVGIVNLVFSLKVQCPES